jgi:hypothetical protein
METWMTTTERSMNDTQNTELSLEQYKSIVNKFKVCSTTNHSEYHRILLKERLVCYETDLFSRLINIS